jgi:hypothetical protein
MKWIDWIAEIGSSIPYCSAPCCQQLEHKYESSMDTEVLSCTESCTGLCKFCSVSRLKPWSLWINVTATTSGQELFRIAVSDSEMCRSGQKGTTIADPAFYEYDEPSRGLLSGQLP